MSGHKFTLKELRARHNLTQAQIAKIVGITTKTYSLLEKDYSNLLSCRWVTVARIANYYNIDMDQIFLPVDVIKNNIDTKKWFFTQKGNEF